MARDYYDILGIAKGASQDEIKRSYRKLAMEFHPDRNPDNPEAEDRFKEIALAYNTLSDPQKRSKYDTYGDTSAGGGSGFSGAQMDYDDILDIFNNAFGGGGGFGGFGFGRQNAGPKVYRGKDLRISLDLTLEEIAVGITKKVKVSRKVHCETCGGDGVFPGAKLVTCQTCKGQGQVQRVVNTLLGQSVSITTCPDCNGRGKRPTKFCESCHGSGLMSKAETIEVKAPAGVKDGNYMVINDKGDAGKQSGPYGDLAVIFREKNHKIFKRDNDNLHIIKPITFSQAALGDEVKIPTINGEEIDLEIPSGIQFGKQIQIKGKGLPRFNSHRIGELIVQVVISTPKTLNSKQKELFQEISELEEEAIFENNAGILGKIKDFFGF